MAQVTPVDSAGPTGAQAAAAYMCELLLRPGRYRRKWEQYAARSRAGQVNQLAVAEVLAHYLWQHPRAKGDTDILPRQLKDTASRALSGKLLSRATLTLFMAAFGFGPPEREQLLKLWEGSAHVRVLSGPRAIRDDKAAALGRPRLKTLSLHDHHYLGPDGMPMRHRVIHVIEAVVDGLDRVPYRADTNALTIEEFHPDKLPREVVWGVWDGMDGPIVEREHVALDSQFAVHRYLRLAEKTAVGFHWDW